MASTIQKKLISAEESVADYGFKEGREVTITGMDLTADKIKLIMKEAALTMNLKSRNPRVALENYQKFKQFCKNQQADLTFS